MFDDLNDRRGFDTHDIDEQTLLEWKKKWMLIIGDYIYRNFYLSVVLRYLIEFVHYKEHCINKAGHPY